MNHMQKGAVLISLQKYLVIALMLIVGGAWGPAQAQHKKAMERETSVTVPIPAFQMNTCQVGIVTESHQRDELARVLTTIEEESCAPTSVTYELSVVITDDNGQNQNLSFSETWKPGKDVPTEFSRDYSIGKNVTLKRVMVRSIQCECADASD